jgi:hypothetical protein
LTQLLQLLTEKRTIRRPQDRLPQDLASPPLSPLSNKDMPLESIRERKIKSDERVNKPLRLRKSQSLANIGISQQEVIPAMPEPYSNGIPLRSMSSSLYPASHSSPQTSVFNFSSTVMHYDKESTNSIASTNYWPNESIPVAVDILLNNRPRLPYEDLISNLIRLYPGVLYLDSRFQYELFGMEGEPETIDAQSITNNLAGRPLDSVLEKYKVKSLIACRRAVSARGGNGALPLISSLKSSWHDIAHVLVSKKWILEVDDTVYFISL